MKGDLSLAFETVRGSIFHEPLRPARIHQGNQILVDIMREANGGKPEFNPQALRERGINPRSFSQVLAFTYAYATLQWHDNNAPFQDVLVARCKNCLDTKDEYSFGHFLSKKMKTEIQDKLARNEPKVPTLDA